MTREWWADGPEDPDVADAHLAARDEAALKRHVDNESERDFYDVYPNAGRFPIFPLPKKEG